MRLSMRCALPSVTAIVVSGIVVLAGRYIWNSRPVTIEPTPIGLDAPTFFLVVEIDGSSTSIAARTAALYVERLLHDLGMSVVQGGTRSDNTLKVSGTTKLSGALYVDSRTRRGPGKWLNTVASTRILLESRMSNEITATNLEGHIYPNGSIQAVTQEGEAPSMVDGYVNHIDGDSERDNFRMMASTGLGRTLVDALMRRYGSQAGMSYVRNRLVYFEGHRAPLKSDLDHDVFVSVAYGLLNHGTEKDRTYLVDRVLRRHVRTLWDIGKPKFDNLQDIVWALILHLRDNPDSDVHSYVVGVSKSERISLSTLRERFLYAISKPSSRPRGWQNSYSFLSPREQARYLLKQVEVTFPQPLKSVPFTEGADHRRSSGEIP
jgi:hypothetical protein